MVSQGALRRSVGLLCLASIWPIGCVTKPSRPLGGLPSTDPATAVDILDLEGDLRMRASSETCPAGIVPRPVAFPAFLGPEPTVEVMIADRGATVSTVELSTSLSDPQIAATSVDDFTRRPLSRRTVASYVQGRAALARGDARAAVRPLEQAVQGGGGPEALDALAEALEFSGRTTDALAIRREMARGGWISSRDRVQLVEDLLRRGAATEAIAIASAGVVVAEGDRDRTRAALILDMTLGAAGRAPEAARLRASMLADEAIDLELARFDSPEALALFWKSVGDDAARDGRVEDADLSWRMAAEINPLLPLGVERLVWAAAGLSRDALVQVMILDAIDRDDSNIEATIELGLQSGSDLSDLRRILAGRVEAEPGRLSAARALAALDPQEASRVFADIAASGRADSIAGILVDAAAPGGPSAAWRVASGFGENPESMDTVVDRLLAGPWSADDLLRVVIDEEEADSRSPSTPGRSAIAAELLRRQARPDLGSSMLDRAERATAAVRLVRIRLAGDFGDPIAVLAVPASPFDERIEAERVSVLLEVGEPELALQVADEGLLAAPASPSLHAARGRVLSTFRDADFEAWTEFEQAWSLGDRSAETGLELARLSGNEQVALEIGPGVLGRIRRELLGLDAFRRISDVDSGGASLDSLEVERLMEPLLDDPSWRSTAMARMLSAWRSSGRLADGRARLQAMVAESPSDPLLSDALHAIDRVIDGPRSAAIDLRQPAADEISGHRARRLELVLAEIPESRREWLGVVQSRIDRLPPGSTKDLRRLEWLLGQDDPQDPSIVAGIVGRFDAAAMTPRMRRAFVTVAAALSEGRGREIVDSVAAWHRSSGVSVDVDTALALVYALGPDQGRETLMGLAASAPITRLDPEWHDRLLAPDSIGSVPIESIATILEFAVASLAPESSPANLVRTAVVAAIVAGVDGGRILEILERAGERGWPLHEAWGVENDGSPLDLPLLEAASDASLLGAEDVSIRILEAVVDADPLDAMALNNLGYALLESGRYEEAARHIEASLELDPESPSTADSMGWLRYADGRHDPDDEDGALQWILRSIQARTRAGRQLSSEVILHLGDAAWRSGRQADAVRAWKSILETGADGLSARRISALDSYQMEAWGGVLVPSVELQERLEGRYITAARRRLEAVAVNEEPETTPTREERSAGTGVQEPGG